MKNKVLTFIKSQNMLFLIFTIFLIFLIFYSRSIINSEKLFIAEANTKDLSINKGLIILNYKTHYFVSPKINYKGKDLKLKSYKAGFYVGKTKIYEIYNNKNNKEFNLKSVLENEDFSVYEPSKNSLIFNKSTLKKLESMEFRFVGKTTDNKDFTLKVPITISEI